MIGLDTNVLVRYLAQDEPDQSRRATQLIEQELSDREPGFISLLVLVETCWVLRRLYGATAAELRATVRDLLDARQFVLGQHTIIVGALGRLAEGQGDIADALISGCALEAGCTRVLTFDRRAVRTGMELLQ